MWALIFRGMRRPAWLRALICSIIFPFVCHGETFQTKNIVVTNRPFGIFLLYPANVTYINICCFILRLPCMLHAAWRVFSLSRGACMTWNVFRNGCRTLASGIIWVFHSPFFGSTLLWSRCMPCFEGLLFYDFGAGAQAVLLADAVLIPGLIRNSWDEKACCPFNFYECRPLLRRDVSNQTACICKLFFFCLLEFQWP